MKIGTLSLPVSQKFVSRDPSERTIKFNDNVSRLTTALYTSRENRDFSVLAVAQVLKLAKCQNEKSSTKLEAILEM